MVVGAATSSLAGALARRKAKSQVNIGVPGASFLPKEIAPGQGPQIPSVYGIGAGAVNRSGEITLPSTTETLPGPAPQTPETPAPVPTEEEWLSSDPDYLANIADLDRSLGSYRGQNTQAVNDYEGNYTDAKRRLGESQGKDTEDLRENFATRGLLRSGIFANSLGELVNNYGDQGQSLDTQRQTTLRDFGNDLTNAQNEDTIARGKVRREAIARRAAATTSS